MKKILFYVITGTALVSITSCNKKLPSACFTASKTETKIYTPIEFTSCSENAVKYEWSFGDGTTAEGESASHQYSKKGTYLVTLKTYSKKDKAIDKASSIITITDPPVIAKRYLTKIIVTAFSQNKPSGSNWDGGLELGSSVNPDIFVNLKYTDGSYQYSTATNKDVIQTDLPISYMLAPNNIFLTDTDWTIEIKDDDTNWAGGTTIMQSFSANLATASATNGKISLTDGIYSIDIYFEER